jgi:predicted RNase H-like nuclease (RuvC/YqgF family)
VTDPNPDPNAPDPNEPEPFDEERAKAKIAKANSEAAQLRKRAKEAEDKVSTLEARLDELEGKDKSEVEKLTAKLAEYDRKAQEAEQRALRAEVAASKGLTPAQAKRLQGGSLEELEADADELLESFKPQEGNGSGPLPGKPTEQLRGGSDPTTEPEELDPAKLADQVSRGF